MKRKQNIDVYYEAKCIFDDIRFQLDPWDIEENHPAITAAIVYQLLKGEEDAYLSDRHAD